MLSMVLISRFVIHNFISDTLAINLDLNKGKHYKFRQISIQFTDSLMVQRAAVQTLGVQKQVPNEKDSDDFDRCSFRQL